MPISNYMPSISHDLPTIPALIWRRRSESKADHLQPWCFGLSFALKIQAFGRFGKTALSVVVQRTFNARLLKNSLKVDLVTKDLLSHIRPSPEGERSPKIRG
jgi:hypothetical protein